MIITVAVLYMKISEYIVSDKYNTGGHNILS